MQHNLTLFSRRADINAQNLHSRDSKAKLRKGDVGTSFPNLLGNLHWVCQYLDRHLFHCLLREVQLPAVRDRQHHHAHYKLHVPSSHRLYPKKKEEGLKRDERRTHRRSRLKAGLRRATSRCRRSAGVGPSFQFAPGAHLLQGGGTVLSGHTVSVGCVCVKCDSLFLTFELTHESLLYLGNPTWCLEGAVCSLISYLALKVIERAS